MIMTPEACSGLLSGGNSRPFVANPRPPRVLSTRFRTCAAPSTACLKEWSPIVRAIHDGKQTILFRKGGIRESSFAAEPGQSCLLFPTGFHTSASVLQPSASLRYNDELEFDPKRVPVVTLDTGAVITGVWTTEDPGVVEALEELHIWGKGLLDRRLKWRPRQPITVLELRGFRLAQLLSVPTTLPGLFGCFSWIPQLSVAGVTSWQTTASPALDDEEFGKAQQRCRAALSRLAVTPHGGD